MEDALQSALRDGSFNDPSRTFHNSSSGDLTRVRFKTHMRVAPGGAAPLGAQATSVIGCFCAEHQVGLPGDRPRALKRFETHSKQESQKQSLALGFTGTTNPRPPSSKSGSCAP